MVDKESQPGDQFEAWVGDDHQEVVHPSTSSQSQQPPHEASDSEPRPQHNDVADSSTAAASAVDGEQRDASEPRNRKLRSPLTPATRRIRLPLIFFVLTCFSTYLVGATFWVPVWYFARSLDMNSLLPLRQALIANWWDGLVYSGCLLGILMTHEMGHFLATLAYRIPASFPYFLPLPITPIGTLGAVISMDGRRANRKEIFDIGLAGPIAGLLVALPILYIGVQRLDFAQSDQGVFALDCPLLIRWMLDWIEPSGYQSETAVWIGQVRGNPYFMAGWVGCLLTGLNMLPVSQLDGGHVSYTLFGKAAHWIARLFMLTALVYIYFTDALQTWGLMFLLVLLIGVAHPPTRDDTVEIGWTRKVIGTVSLVIPFLCLPPRVIYM